MFNAHKEAKAFAEKACELGVLAGDVEYSSNRNGDKSAYLSLRKGRKFSNVRISDHMSSSVTAHCNLVNTMNGAYEFLAKFSA